MVDELRAEARPQMQQDDINKLRMDDLERNGARESLYQLELTSKHRLDVGCWTSSIWGGVDLRRRSLAKGNLLGQGLAVSLQVWRELFAVIREIHDTGGFTNYGDWTDERYTREIVIDESYALQTSRWEGYRPYFSVQLKKGGKDVFVGKHTRKAIIILFQSMSDFVALAEQEGLAPAPKHDTGTATAEIDPATGRSIA